MRKQTRGRTGGVVLAFVVIASSACSMTKGGVPTAPTTTGNAGSDAAGRVRLEALTGTWTGSETASFGESGSLSVTFVTDPAQSVTATISWTSATSHVTYTGTVTGTLSNVNITANNYGCSYNAHGVLNEAGTQISGTYSGSGPGACPMKAGTFVLNAQAPPIVTPPVVPPPVVDPPSPPVDPSCAQSTFKPLELTVEKSVLDGKTKIYNWDGATWELDLYRDGVLLVYDQAKSLKDGCTANPDLSVHYQPRDDADPSAHHTYMLTLTRNGVIMSTVTQ